MNQTELLNIASQLKADGALRAQWSNGWGKAPRVVSGQRAAELEAIASDCCQCNTNPRSTRA